MAKKIIKYFSIFVLTTLFVFLTAFFKRTPIIELLTIDKTPFKKIDLFVILGGGFRKGKIGNSTKERLETFIEKYQKTNMKIPILVCEYPEGKKKMEFYINNKIEKKLNFLKSTYHYKEIFGGTENNIKEVLNVVKNKENINNILVITSPYHELRTYLIFKRLKKQMKLKKQLKINFLHPKNFGEIKSTNNKRFFKLVIHELGGIVYELVVN